MVSSSVKKHHESKQKNTKAEVIQINEEIKREKNIVLKGVVR